MHAHARVAELLKKSDHSYLTAPKCFAQGGVLYCIVLIKLSHCGCGCHKHVYTTKIACDSSFYCLVC